MQYNRLGATGLNVSRLCLGAMTFGAGFNGIGEVGKDLADRLVGRPLEAGVNFFDTADVYPKDESEEILGRAIENSSTPRDALRRREPGCGRARFQRDALRQVGPLLR